MKTCYLHVGHAKTATSFLQAFMHKNDDILQHAGIWVPGDYRAVGSLNCKALAEDGMNFEGNFGPIFHATENKEFEQTGALLEHVFSCECDVLLSTELLFYYNFVVRDVINCANDHGFVVTVIAYLRRQDRAVVPAYCQNIRNHGYFKDPLSFLEDTAAARYFRYCEVLDAYDVNTPNKIVVRTFEPEHLVGGDVVADLLNVLGLDVSLDLYRRPNKAANYSLPLESLEIIRGLNALGRTNIVDKVISISSADTCLGEGRRTQSHYYTSELALVVKRQYMSTNDRLVDNYLPDHSKSERHYWLGLPDAPSGNAQLDVTKLAKALSAILPAGADA